MGVPTKCNYSSLVSIEEVLGSIESMQIDQLRDVGQR